MESHVLIAALGVVLVLIGVCAKKLVRRIKAPLTPLQSPVSAHDLEADKQKDLMDTNGNDNDTRIQVHALKSQREKIKTTLDIVSNHESSFQDIESMLPACIFQPASFREHPNQLKAALSQQHSDMRVLIVDEIYSNIFITRIRLLEISSAWTFTECASAKEAVIAAQGSNFHLIIMHEEFAPGEMTGAEAIKAIRDNETTQKVSDDKKAIIVYWNSWSVYTELRLPPGGGADFAWPKIADMATMQEAIDAARAKA